jgi:hypothetical protein
MSVYQTRRSGLLAELVADGWSDADAAAAIRAWEFESNRRGIDQRTENFWREGQAWIVDRRPTSIKDDGPNANAAVDGVAPIGSEANDGSGGFDWGSPRWREGEPGAAEAERGRRFQDTSSPAQKGAVDGHSVEPSRRRGREPNPRLPEG